MAGTFPAQSPQYSFVKIPMFDTIIISYGGGVEQRIAQQDEPVYKFKMKFTGKSQELMQEILDFFIAKKGSYESFTVYDELNAPYLVRFAEDLINIEYFEYLLYDLGEIEFIQVTA